VNRRAWLGIWIAFLLASCGAGPATGAPNQASPHPADACRGGATKPAIPVIFLAKEVVPAELNAVRRFVDVWGTGHSCFEGKVVTSLKGVDMAHYRVLIVDISHDAILDRDDMNALLAFTASGRRLGLFDYALALSDNSRTNSILGGETLIGRMDFSLAPGCVDWQYGARLSSPFALAGTNYHYPTQADATLAMRADGPSRTWATLSCQGGGAAVLEVPPGLIAGFYIAGALSRGDDDPAGAGMAKLVVDVIESLTHASTL